MESSDLSKVFGKMGSLISDFANKLSTEMDEKFGKVGKYLDKLSLTGEQKMELISLYKKLSNEESSLLKDLIKRGDKDGLKLLLSKYLTDENIIEAVIASSSIWKETTDIGKNLEKDITDILKDINKDEDNIFNSMGGLQMEVSEQQDEEVARIESLYKPWILHKWRTEDGNVVFSFAEFNEISVPLQGEPYYSCPRNFAVTSHEQFMKEVQKNPVGELPLDFRLRMMENTIQKLDSKLNSDSEKSNEIEELSEKIDDISVNLDLLITQLSRLLK